MDIQIIKSEKGDLSFCSLDEVEIVEDASDFLGLLLSCPTDTIVINMDRITEKFFNLKNGIAGEILQKVSNYRKRLIILGDYERISMSSFHDFMYESNKHGKVVFAGNLDKAVLLLK